MKLIEALVQELPRRGGWPEGVEEIWQDYDRMMRPLGWFHDELCEDHRRKHCDAHVKINRKQYESAIEASKKEWDGDGLPPVGCECEIAASTPYLNITYPEGAVVKIYAHFTDDRGVELAAFVGASGKVGGVCTAKCFRPIRSEEDKRKEAEIDELIDAINLTLTDIYASRVFMDAIRNRRIPGIRIN